MIVKCDVQFTQLYRCDTGLENRLQTVVLGGTDPANGPQTVVQWWYRPGKRPTDSRTVVVSTSQTAHRQSYSGGTDLANIPQMVVR